MSLALPLDAKSLCWSCRYWNWAIQLGPVGGENDWINECSNPAEYAASDTKTECTGYTEAK